MVNVNIFTNYLGLGEKPSDFDEFWNKGKKEVDKLGTSYELKQVDLPSHVDHDNQVLIFIIYTLQELAELEFMLNWLFLRR